MLITNVYTNKCYTKLLIEYTDTVTGVGMWVRLQTVVLRAVTDGIVLSGSDLLVTVQLGSVN